MTKNEMLQESDALIERVSAAQTEARPEFLREINRLTDEMRRRGISVPQKLKRLDQALTDQSVEARFDNLPV